MDKTIYLTELCPLLLLDQPHPSTTLSHPACIFVQQASVCNVCNHVTVKHESNMSRKLIKSMINNKQTTQVEKGLTSVISHLHIV